MFRSVRPRLADPELAADLLDRRAGLSLPQGKGDLFFREPFALHGTSCPFGANVPEKLPSPWTGVLEADHSRGPRRDKNA
jgi:hypothetical protein